MTILISGGCKNGKSSLAQDLAVKMSAIARSERPKQSRPIYFATMIPHDSEDLERIEKHRADRKNLGFETIECGKNLSETIESMESGRVVLFDSLTALVANELFGGEGSDESAVLKSDSDILDATALFHHLCKKSAATTQKIRADLTALTEKSESVIFVSDAIFSDGKIYDESTELYRKILAETENFIAKKSDKVVEMVSGKRKMENGKLKTRNFHLVIGGAYQGKTAWAKEQFSLSDDDICVCDSDSLPDFSKRCISHYENYVAYCLKHNLAPKTDFSDCANERAGEGKGAKIIISDDIFCGVVPIDAFQRKWREETGLALQKIAKNAAVWRVFCGIATRIQ
ncbi:MAG: bifunctional adenosylcobinamide kinase/adenosylcobinamide-phosphate guanylyltransferase [Treponema sp.]|nr:bifunctional adenosylcobinamide kinase/adenosylcobinamide-phosphate guanylyltransferase [Treponema sp.]